MTVDMVFWYKGNRYYLESIYHKYAILTEKEEMIVSDTNFRSLLNKPVEKWEKRTFKELIGEMLFEN